MGIAVRTMKAESEDRQSDVARISGAIDDLGAWQHQPDETEIVEVARHLIDDAFGVRRERMQRGEIVCRGGIEPSAVEAGDADDGGHVVAAAEDSEPLSQGNTLTGAVRVAVMTGVVKPVPAPSTGVVNTSTVVMPVPVWLLASVTDQVMVRVFSASPLVGSPPTVNS